MEVSTDGIMDLKCTSCHAYILDEIGASNSSIDVWFAHLNATMDTNYVGIQGDGTPLEFPNYPPLFGGSKGNVCQLCHVAETGTVAADGSHTKLTIRLCTDVDCHGNSTSRGVTLPKYAVAGYVGLNLSSSKDLHSGWFKELEKRESRYANEDGGNYSQGYIACLGCHTHVGISIKITRPNSYNISMSANISGWTISEVGINEFSTTTNSSSAVIGSKWN